MNKWKVAAYVRLSSEDDNDKSNSIMNQIEIIDKYVENKNDMELVDYYIDNGCSGTDFNRKGFARMMSDIKDKKVNTIIVKDLSRFGRNHIEVDNYLGNIFPMLKVRFISINDNVDIKKDTEVIENLEIPIKNLMNETYSYDISTKVKSVIYMKKEKGEFVGISAPFGYLKDPKDKHKYILDEDASKIVIKIFDMTLVGKTRREISEELNRLEILPPGLYKIEKGLANYNKTSTMNKWNPEMINRILRNRNYTGDLIQGIAKRINYRNHKLIKTDKEDWIITENHHKAIISKEKFNKVQSILNRRINNKDVLKGYLKCADCGKSIIIKKSKGHEYYYCSSYIRNSSCTNHSVKKDELLEKVLNKINDKSNSENVKLTFELVDKYINQIKLYEQGKIEIEFKD